MSAEDGKRPRHGASDREDGNGNEIDDLFQLPLDEFTGARNALASRLKKAGQDKKAAKVKALVKPSISAWAVNQLYWKHRVAFNDFLEASRRVTQAQIAQLSGKDADMKKVQVQHRQVISDLSHLADALLREAGRNPTPDTMRRVSNTLEALSAYSTIPDAPRPGHLVADVNPPGFEAVAALIPAGGRPKPRVKRTNVVPFKPLQKTTGTATKGLRESPREQQALAAARMKAAAEVNEAEERRREAEERYREAKGAEAEARRHLESLTAEAEQAARALKDAELAVEKAHQNLNR